MGLKIVVQPEAELLTIEECRAHLNIQPYEIDSDGAGTHPDDAQIMAMQSAAREFCEDFTGLSLVEKTYELALDAFPTDEIAIPMPPAIQIVSVTYADSEQVEQIVAGGDYTLDNYQMPAWLIPASGASWPSAGNFMNAVRVRFVAGYGSGSDSEPLPFVLRAALLLVLGHLYANREDSSAKALSTIPTGAEALMRPRRIRFGMA